MALQKATTGRVWGCDAEFSMPNLKTEKGVSECSAWPLNAQRVLLVKTMV